MSNRFGALVLFLLLSASVSAESMRLDFDFPAPAASQTDAGLQYEIQGLEFTAIPGEPRLPVKREFVRIPRDAMNVRVILNGTETESLGEVDGLAVSKQPVIMTAGGNSPALTIAGGHSLLFPEGVYSFRIVEGFRDHKVVSISIFPLQHSDEELLFHRRVSLRLEYELPKKRVMAGSAASNATKYIIITDSSLNSSLEPLKEWKTKKGVPAEIYTVQWIYQNYNGTENRVFHSGEGNGKSNYMRRTLNLGNATSANLTLSTKFKIEEGWDFGYVEVSLDGGNWTQLQGEQMTDYREPEAYVGTDGAYSYTGNSSWVQDTINLSGYAGEEIQLRFRYVTDTYVSFGGWWLDNITVTTDQGVLFSAEGNSTTGWGVSGFSNMDLNSHENPSQKLIRDFITDRYEEGAEWVLLAGANSQVPSLTVSRTWYEGDDDEVPTDYYYSCLGGDWNTDWDSNYGEHEHSDVGDEITDWIPDVYVGRLPVSTAAAMGSLVSAIINYEKSPPLDSSEWFSRALLAGGTSDETTDDAYLMELVRTDLLEPGNFSNYRLYYSSTYTKDAQLNYPNFETYVSYGNSIVLWSGHGLYAVSVPCSTCSAFVDTETDPANGEMLPLVYADSCLTGAFDQTNSLGNQALKNWAIGYVGASRTSYYTQGWVLGDGFNQELVYRFFEQFINGSHQPGKTLADMKSWYYVNQWPTDEGWGTGDASKKNLVGYNLLGDPEVPIWNSVPENFTVEFPSEIYPGENSIVVNVSGSAGPVENARVCLQGSVEYTNSSGAVEFEVTASGPMNLTVTKDSFIPYEGNISVVSDSDPPAWDSTTGIHGVTSGDGSITANWNNASDLSLPVTYNLYYDTTREWLCQYSNINASDILGTDFDLVDLDPDDLDSSQVSDLKDSGKFTLAYINIGWAENWRSYWNPSWETESPPWLLDEAEWEDEYYVDFSQQEWQSIVHNYIDEINAKGFSGIYMDNVEAGYQRHESNLSDARYENCTRENMIEFIQNISLTHRSGNFSIFPQNGLDIALNLTDYIDGVGVEDTYYEDTGSPVDSETTSLKEATLDNLTAEGKLVLTLDYTTEQTEIDSAYSQSSGRGYVPYVSIIDLNQLTVNEGHGPEPVTETGTKIEGVTSHYTLQNLTNGKIYYFTVRAKDGAGNEDGNNVTLYGVPFLDSGCELKGDSDCDGAVSDFELLNYIDQWVNGEVDDFDLLEAIDNWANQ
ncbi:MAG: C25 family cysteine peptidase [Candidatus Altiarchaeales archaeon]|nr:endo alpha-1,4 polygalactosaminidase [Candidatus Altiarchaeota archaeon]MCG2783282.1 C25 family cysteine peptidase [Candidatus Altiarchaeales archaeon]